MLQLGVQLHVWGHEQDQALERCLQSVLPLCSWCQLTGAPETRHHGVLARLSQRDNSPSESPAETKVESPVESPAENPPEANQATHVLQLEASMVLCGALPPLQPHTSYELEVRFEGATSREVRLRWAHGADEKACFVQSAWFEVDTECYLATSGDAALRGALAARARQQPVEALRLLQEPTQPEDRETAWYRCYQRARCELDLDDVGKAFLTCAQCLDAARHGWCARRLEPLYHLAGALRRKQMSAMAYVLVHSVFLREGWSLEAPAQARLRVEHDVYRHGLLFELSVAAFYADDLRTGLRASDALLLTQQVPTTCLAAVRANLLYYLQPLLVSSANQLEVADCSGGALQHRTREVTCLAKPPRSFLFNPGLCLWRGQLVLNVRMCDAGADFRPSDSRGARVQPCERWPLRSLNFRAVVDGATLLAVPATPGCLTPHWSEPRPRLPRSFGGAFRGLEDSRLFVLRDEVWFLATSQEFRPDHVNAMHLCSPRAVVALEGPRPGRHEKNWLPFVVREPERTAERLLCIYSFGDPDFVVLEIDPDTGRVADFLRRNDHLPNWRGSAGPVRREQAASATVGNHLAGDYYAVVHECYQPMRLYVHRFLRLRASPTLRDLRVTHCSRPFRLAGRHHVEYVCGLALRNDEVFLSWGENDERAFLSAFPFAALDALLLPLES